MTEDLSGQLHRLAVRAALLIVSQRDDPDIVQRLLDFAQDRGAVGLLLRQHESGESIEAIALSYWDSRIEKTGSRFEDLVTTTLLSILSGIVANILSGMWKGEFGPLPWLIHSEEKERLRLRARKEPQFRRDLQKIAPIYLAKNAGAFTESEARDLFDILKAGGTFSDVEAQHPREAENNRISALLVHANSAARGVLLTEIHRANGVSFPEYHLDRKGLPLCDYLAFGEVISLFNSDDLGLGPNWQKRLAQKFTSNYLYPEAWPLGTTSQYPSPKVLVLNEQILDRLKKAGEDHWIAESVGLISTNSGMNDHLGVLSRSLGIGAVGCHVTEEECTSAKFALIQKENLRFYRDIPNLTTGDFTRLISELRRPSHRGD